MPITAPQAVAAMGRFDARWKGAARNATGPATSPASRDDNAGTQLPLDIRNFADSLPALTPTGHPPAGRRAVGITRGGWQANLVRLLAVSSVLRPLDELSAGPMPVAPAVGPTRCFNPAMISPDWPEPFGSAGVVADQSGALQLAGELLSAWFADPCTDPDAAFNGLWRIAHPPADPPPSLFAEAQHELAIRLATLLAAPVPAGASAARQALGDTWHSAFADVPGNWADFSPQANALRRFTSVDAALDHAIAGALGGRESLIGLYDVGGTGVLAANLPLLPFKDRSVYRSDADPSAVAAYRSEVEALLVKAGMPVADARVQAPDVVAMETVMAAASSDLDRCTLAQAQALVPALPWARIWSGLGLLPDTRLFLTTGFFEQLAALLPRHDVAAWQAFVWLQEARNAQDTIQGPRTAGSVLRKIDSEEAGSAALQSVYAATLEPSLVARGQTTFDGVREAFVDAVAASGLGAADQQRMRAMLLALRLDTTHGGRAEGWTGTSATAPLLANLQALRASAAVNAVAAVNAGHGSVMPPAASHVPFAGAGFVPGTISVSLALLDVAQRIAGGEPEGWWGLLGSVLGHEVAHWVADITGLDDLGKALLARRQDAVAQRIGDVRSGTVRLDPKVTANEALADLRGIRAALLASRAEAAAAGRPHDDAAFFRAAVQTHAAHMTPGQLRQRLGDEHPPGPLRAQLPPMVEGYEQAFDCRPRPTAPFRDLI